MADTFLKTLKPSHLPRNQKLHIDVSKGKQAYQGKLEKNIMVGPDNHAVFQEW